MGHKFLISEMKMKWRAKNLSTLMATTPQNEAVENKNSNISKAPFVLQATMFCCIKFMEEK